VNRLILKDEQWERVAPLLPGKAGDPGRSGTDNRLFLEAVLWMVRTGAPWRDLPERFGNWNSVFRRFRRWAQTSVLEHVFHTLSAGVWPFQAGKHAASARRLSSARGIFTSSRSCRDVSKLALHNLARTAARASPKVR
jgi:transposase